MQAAVLKRLRQYYTTPLDFAEPDRIPEVCGDTALVHMQPLEKVLGAERLGHGNFAIAFGISKKWCIKLLKQRDRGYDAYAEYCMKHPNPWAPRILARMVLNDRVRAYVMERLHPCPRGAADKLRHCLHDPSTAPCPQLRALLEGFGTRNFTDFYDRNIMRRADGHLVITDPCHYFYGVGAMLEPVKVHPAFEAGDWRITRHGFNLARIKADEIGPAICDLIVNPCAEGGVVKTEKAKAPRPHEHLIWRVNERLMRRPPKGR